MNLLSEDREALCISLHEDDRGCHISHQAFISPKSSPRFQEQHSDVK
ncbi:MAG TPA: hypothetical protein PLV96_02725 [Methanoregulaceae archaeon]|nr:hypothetical protein [Methanoregulaceae archaeon]